MTTQSEWLKFRKSYLQDKKSWEGYYVCQNPTCGKWVLNIQVDHIQRRGSHPELVLEESNLQLLCQDCHLKKDGGMK